MEQQIGIELIIQLLDIRKQICYSTDSILRICEGARGLALNSNTCVECFFYVLELTCTPSGVCSVIIPFPFVQGEYSYHMQGSPPVAHLCATFLFFGATGEGGVNHVKSCISREVVGLIHDMTVFSRSKDGSRMLTPNFQVREFACQDGSDPVFIHPLLPLICQAVRNYFGYPFSPTSAYRTVSHNASAAVGGAKGSNHIYGRAVDIPVSGDVTPQQVYDFLDKLMGNWGELGLYSWGVHVGISSTKSRFRG